MTRICESFAQEYDLLFNAKKTVCILFSGRSRRFSNAPPLYMNNVLLKWTKSAKHLGSIVTYDLTESEEITQKRNDFIGRANSVISNFKHVDRNVSSRVFMSQCCHLFGSQVWQLDSKSITGFSTAWRKAIRKLWCLPNTTRSDIVPYLDGAPPLEEQLFHRVAKMYNSIRKGFNSKMLLLLQMSGCADKMGIMGINPKLLASDGVVVLNICSATTHLIIPRPPPKLRRLKSSWTIIFLVSPQMKLQISLLTLPATKCNKHVSVVNNHFVTSITSWYVYIFSLFFCVFLFVPLFLCSVLRVRNKYIYIMCLRHELFTPFVITCRCI